MHIKNKLIFFLLGVLLLILTFFYIVTNTAILSTEVSPRVSVLLAHVQYQDMSKSITTYGQVSFSPSQTKQLSVQYEALIKKIFIIPGQQIKLRDPLLELTSSINFESTLEDAQLAVTFAEKELKRISGLRKQFLATNAEVQTAEQNLGKAKIKLLSLENQKKGSTLKARFPGTIISVNVQSGQIVSANTSLLTYAKGNERQIRLGVENEDLPKLKPGQRVNIYALQNTLYNQSDTIKNISGMVDPTTGLIDVVIDLKNAPHFIPGSIVRGEIITQEKVQRLTIPRSAVLYQQKKPYVFVVANGKAYKRFVIVGEVNSQVISIDKGLNIDDIVVCLGNYELKNGMDVVEEKQ